MFSRALVCCVVTSTLGSHWTPEKDRADLYEEYHSGLNVIGTTLSHGQDSAADVQSHLEWSNQFGPSDSLRACANLLLGLPFAEASLRAHGKRDRRTRDAANMKGFGNKGSSSQTQGFGTKKQKSHSGKSASKLKRPSDWDAFEKWFVAKGGVVNGIELAQCKSGLRGLCATRAIKRGETILSVPREIILDESLAEATIGRLWSDMPSIPTYAKIGLFVLHEARKSEASDFASYIEMLPSIKTFTDDGGPANLWNSSELALSECSKLISDVEDRRANIASYSILKPEKLAERWKSLGFAGAPPCAEELDWAIAAVTSRAYGAEDANGQKLSLLIPMVDMANHAHPPNTVKGLEKDGKQFTVIASETIARGDEVYLTYGALPNFVLLSQFGFVVDSSASDCALVDCATLVNHEAASTIAIDYLMRDGPSGAISRWQPASPTLREALRLLSTKRALPPSLLDSFSSTGSVVDSDAAYVALIRTTLDGFSSTVGDDRSMLRQSLPPRTRLAVQFRLEQKVLLNRELVSLQASNKRRKVEGV